MNLTMKRWMAILCAMLLAMSLAASAGASAEAVAAGTAQMQANDGEQNDQAVLGALTASANVSQTDAEKAFQALYPDWTVVSARLEDEDNVPAYAIEATDTSGATLEATISAMDGSVIPERIGERNGENGQNEQGDQNEGEPQSGNNEAVSD